MIEFKSIAAALAKAQSTMGKAIKDRENPHFRAKYADLAAVMDACLPALNANGIAVIQPTINIGEGRFVQTILIHEGGERLECSVPLLLGKQDMQGYGSAVTYARRFGLMCMTGIAPEDDDGNEAAKSPVTEVAKPRGAHFNATDRAAAIIGAIEKSADVDALKAIWAENGADLRAIKADSDGMFKTVEDAKAKRRLELTAAKNDLDGDEVPY